MIDLYTQLRQAGLPVLAVSSRGHVEWEHIPSKEDAEKYRAILKSRTNILTKRQLEILSMASKGLGNKQIAYSLGITTQTVKNHMVIIYDQLGAVNRPNAILIATQRGIL